MLERNTRTSVNIRSALLRAQKGLTQVDAKRLEQYSAEKALIKELTELGVSIHRIPDSVYPGMPYVLMQEFAASEATQYSVAHLSRIVEPLGAIRLGGRGVLIPLPTVSSIRTAEKRRTSGDESLGRIPGLRKTAGGWVKPRSEG